MEAKQEDNIAHLCKTPFHPSDRLKHYNKMKVKEEKKYDIKKGLN